MNALTIVLLLPFIGFLINGILGSRLPKALVSLLACGLPAASFVLSFALFRQVSATGNPVVENLFSWAALSGFEVEAALYLDHVSAVMCLIITGVGTLIHLYSTAYMAEDKSYARYFAYLNLFLFFMLLLVLGKNLLVLFAGWEGVGIVSYLLIGFWYEDAKKTSAGIKAFVVNRVGDAAFLLAAFLLFYYCGTLDFARINAAFASGLVPAGIASVVALLLLLGACGKSAQIPLHVWLPDAMAGPTPVSALIHAATMVTAGVYLLSRLGAVFLQAPDVMTVVAWGGAITAFAGATMGLTQNNLKKVLAYSTMSQIGFMFMACGVGAFQVAFFHLTTHAFFKACLFLGAGAVIHALHGEEDMRNMGGLAKKLPFTFATFLLASLALCGVPPFAGFFSKDEILWSAWSAAGGSPALWLVGTITSALTAFYMFRAIFMTFFGSCRASEKVQKGIHEAPPAMSFALGVLAFLSVVAGFIGLPGFWRELLGFSAPFYDFLAPVLGFAGEGVVADHHLELVLMLISVAAAFGGILLAWLFFNRRPELSAKAGEALAPARAVVSRGYFFDHIYRGVFVRTADWLSESVLARKVEAILNDGTLFKTYDGVHAASRLFSRMQSGNLKAYVLYAFLGLASILWWGVANV